MDGYGLDIPGTIATQAFVALDMIAIQNMLGDLKVILGINALGLGRSWRLQQKS